MPEFYEVAPAYGRNYTSGKAMRLDWQAGLDFRIVSGPRDVGRYTSSRDFQSGADSVLGRFGKHLDRLATLQAGR